MLLDDNPGVLEELKEKFNQVWEQEKIRGEMRKYHRGEEGGQE